MAEGRRRHRRQRGGPELTAQREGTVCAGAREGDDGGNHAVHVDSASFACLVFIS